jgi:hypothetical protein
LLESGDADRFANDMVASLEDWRGVRMTNAATHANRPATMNQSIVDNERRNVRNSAKFLLSQAARLGLTPGRARFQVKEVLDALNPPFATPIDAETFDLPFCPVLKVILTGDSEDKKLAGECQIGLSGGMKFSRGWRIFEGLRWLQFPPGMGDETLRRDVDVAGPMESPRRAARRSPTSPGRSGKLTADSHPHRRSLSPPRGRLRGDSWPCAFPSASGGGPQQNHQNDLTRPAF